MAEIRTGGDPWESAFARCGAPLIALRRGEDGGTRGELLERWDVYVDGDSFVVPPSSVTDGASIPRFLWRVCGHPMEVPRIYAALLHDWLYSPATTVSRARADRCYRALLRHFGVAAWRAAIEYRALRIFGGSHYEGGL